MRDLCLSVYHGDTRRISLTPWELAGGMSFTCRVHGYTEVSQSRLVDVPTKSKGNEHATNRKSKRQTQEDTFTFVFQFVFLVVFALFWLLFACFCCFCCPCWSCCLSAHVFILLFVSFCFYWICFCSLDSLSRDWVFLLYLLGILYSSSTVPLTLSFRSFAVRTFWPSTGWGRVQQRRPGGLQMLFGTIQSNLPNFESHPFGCLAEAHIFKYCFP